MIEGTGPDVVITDKTCDGMELFVIWGNNTTVRNLTLTRSRVPDMNGAGIRLVKGSLTVENVKFIEIKTASPAVYPERRLQSAIAISIGTAGARRRAHTRSTSKT